MIVRNKFHFLSVGTFRTFLHRPYRIDGLLKYDKLDNLVFKVAETLNI